MKVQLFRYPGFPQVAGERQTAFQAQAVRNQPDSFVLTQPRFGMGYGSVESQIERDFIDLQGASDKRTKEITDSLIEKLKTIALKDRIPFLFKLLLSARELKLTEKQIEPFYQLLVAPIREKATPWDIVQLIDQTYQKPQYKEIHFLESDEQALRLKLHHNRALLASAHIGDMDGIKDLLEKNVDIETKDRYGKTALALAAENNHPNVVEALLAKGAVIETKSSNDATPLILAAGNKQDATTTLQTLLAAGANLEATDTYGDTALLQAVRTGHLQNINFLLAQGANIKAKNGFDETPVLLAAKSREQDILALLLSEGKEKINLEETDQEQNTALLLAAQQHKIDCLKLLLDHGANPNVKNADDVIPLSHALDERWKQVAEILLEAGANPNIEYELGNSLLCALIQANEDDLAKVLIEKGKNLNLEGTDRDGNTPLILAAGEGKADLVKLLLEKGAKDNAVNRLGRTALMVVTTPVPDEHQHRNDQVVKVLLKHSNAPVNDVDPNGWTALRGAIANRNAEVAQWLIESGADIFQQSDALRTTPFDMALDSGDEALEAVFIRAYGKEKGAPPPSPWWVRLSKLVHRVFNRTRP